MTILVALSVPVACCDCTAVREGENTGVDGIGIVAESVTTALLIGVDTTGASEMVAFPELGGTMLLGDPEGADTGTSEVGMLLDSAADGVGRGRDETPDPAEPDGKIPERDSLGEGGVMPGLNDGEGVSLAVTPDGVTMGVSLAVTPDGVTMGVSLAVTPDGVMMGVSLGDGTGSASEGVDAGTGADKLSRTLEATLLASGIGIGAVALIGISEAKLDTMLGTTDPGRSGIADESRLERSEANEETMGGRMPIGVGDGEGAAGSVDPAEPDGRTPGTSEMIDDKSDGRSSGPELGEGAASEVGMAPEFRAGLDAEAAGAVPSAVVIPTTMPPDDGKTRNGCSLEGEAGAGVGSTKLLGRTPVEPTCGSGVASGPRMEDRRPPRKPWDVGEGSDAGMPPVEPGTMKGPTKLDAAGADGSGDGTGAGLELAGTIISGMRPVEPMR
jgi:hypothetical protein